MMITHMRLSRHSIHYCCLITALAFNSTRFLPQPLAVSRSQNNHTKDKTIEEKTSIMFVLFNFAKKI